MNLETFNKIMAPKIGKFRITVKGYNIKHKVQSVYKSELPTSDTRRFFLINDDVYELPLNMVGPICDVLDKKVNISNLFYQIYKGNEFVNVPLRKFILILTPHIPKPVFESDNLPF
jgi:hypothetical protein